MIVSHANNHLLTLSEFASDKANYHLKMSSKTLWAKSLHHDSRLYYCGYVTTRIHTHTNADKHAQARRSVQPLNWLQGYHMNALIWWRVWLIAASSWNWFSDSQMMLRLYFPGCWCCDCLKAFLQHYIHVENVDVDKANWIEWRWHAGKSADSNLRYCVTQLPLSHYRN